MIEIAGKPLEMNSFPGLSQLEVSILNSLARTDVVYQYATPQELRFELALRTNTLHASIALLNSGARFEAFKRSYCNPRFWNRMPNGAFQLRRAVRPSDAINDIFYNGQLYGFECATAIIILFYKAVLESIDRPSFDRLFQNLYLYSWEHDEDLHLETREGTDFVIGDCLYFINPDVAPENDVWRGENTIKLDEDLYYGHGTAISTSAQLIHHLNQQRRPGSQISAYLLKQVTRLNFSYVRTFSDTGYTPRTGLDHAIYIQTANRSAFH